MLYLNKMPDDWQMGMRKRIGRNLKRLRLERDWTLNYMQSQVGVDRATLWSWEQATRSPQLCNILWICKCTGWKLSDIIGGRQNA